MSKHLYINQNPAVQETVPSGTLSKIYNYINDSENPLDAISNIIGNIHIRADYEDVYKYIKEKFPQFRIEIEKQWVNFKDKEVEKVLKEHNIDIDNDEGIDINELQNVKDISTWFKNNVDIVSFPELKDTKVTELKIGAFDGCTNLEELDVSKITKLPTDNGFIHDTKIKKLYFENLVNLKTSGWGSVFAGSLYLEFLYTPKLTSCDNVTNSFDNNGKCVWIAPLLSNVPRIRYNWVTTLKLIDVGEFCRSANFDRAGGISYIIRSKVVPTASSIGSSHFDYTPKLCFVHPAYYNKYKYTNVWNQYVVNLHPIGNAQWVEFMKELATMYAKDYANWTDEQINGEWLEKRITSPWIDYAIFGINPPNLELNENPTNVIDFYSSGCDIANVNDTILSSYDGEPNNLGKLITEFDSLIADPIYTIKSGSEYLTIDENNVARISSDADESPVTINVKSESYPECNKDYNIKVTDYRKAGYMEFEDPEVEKVLLKNTAYSAGDGIGLKEEDLSKITNISNWFANNTQITKFNELEKTKVTNFISSGTANYFAGCSNLEEIKLPDSFIGIGTINGDRGGDNRSPFRGTKIKYLDLNNVEYLGANALCYTSIKIDLQNSKVTQLDVQDNTLKYNSGIEILDYTNVRCYNGNEVSYYPVYPGMSNLKIIILGNRYTKLKNGTMNSSPKFEKFVNTKHITEIDGINTIDTYCNLCRGSAPYVFNFPSLQHIGRGNNDQGILNGRNGSDKLKFVGLNSVKGVGSASMANQSHIECIDFGDKIETIMSDFVNNSYFILIVRAINPPILNASINARVKKIFVPNESIDLYKNADNWKSSIDKISYICSNDWESSMRELAELEEKELDNYNGEWVDYTIFDEESPII